MRIVIIGNGGSGKSTLADKLGTDLGIPVLHLDKITWTEDWERVPENEFRDQLSLEMQKPDLIIEGWSYHSTMLDRLRWADAVIYLEFPLEYCLQKVALRNREFNNREYPYDNFTGDRVAMQHIYDEAVRRVHSDYEPQVREWLGLKQFSDKPVIVCRSSDELNSAYPEILHALKSILVQPPDQKNVKPFKHK
ncbi:MAG: hypothetical protein K1X85_02455 [Ignavibacteria bacterium]|nr:hypothetical protein [Ignavibacteria bacterium]